MKTTRRLLLLPVLLIFAVFVRNVYLSEPFPAEPSKHPLPLEVEPADAGELLARLAAKGVASATYDSGSLRILVSREEEKKAVIALAEERLLGEAHEHGFRETLRRWSKGGRFYCDSEVARLIASMDGIADAVVISPVDYGSHDLTPKTASVKVKLERETLLGEEAANTIIAIVAAAEPGLDPRDVVVADQFGNKFRSRYGHSFYSMDKHDFESTNKKRWDAEFAHNELLRLKLEDLARLYVPNIRNEGDIDVFPRCELDIETGEAAAKPEPGIKSVSVIIHLPFHLKQDRERTRRIEERGDIKTRELVWRRESIDSANTTGLALLIARVTGMASDDIFEKIGIHCIPWNNPIYTFEEDDLQGDADAHLVIADDGEPLVQKSEESSEYPLPLKVSKEDDGEKLIARLKAKGIVSAVYDGSSNRILVSRAEEKKAVIALAEEGILGKAHRYGFLETIERWAFPDSFPRYEDSIPLACANEVSRLIESMDGIAEARVFHFENSRVRRLSDGSLRKVALVRVKTEGRTPLEKGTADAVISIVAASRPGLDPRDVTVADQMGNKFHSGYGYSFYAMDKAQFEKWDKGKWDIESALGDWLRPAVEDNVWIRGIQYEGDINVFPEYDVDFDFKEAASKRKRVAVSVVIHLPFRLELKDDGDPAQSIGGTGAEIERKLVWKRVPMDLLPPDRIEDIQGRIARALGIIGDTDIMALLPPDRIKGIRDRIARELGIEDADIPDMIEIHQVLWNDPRRSLKGDGTWADAVTGERLEMEKESEELPEKVTLDCGSGVKMELVGIPPGTFMMGSPKTEVGRSDDEILHRVTISGPFYMGMHEVTQAQYRAVMRTNPSHDNRAGDDFPVDSVSWDDAMEFCQRLSMRTGRTVRLPTEAEWEYACRAGTATPFNLDATANPERNYNIRERGSSAIGLGGDMPVGQFLPNAFGLYDMHGNIWEWCSDWYGEYDTRHGIIDPQGPSSGLYRVSRGGSRFSIPRYCRSAARKASDPADAFLDTGFRVVFDSPADSNPSEIEPVAVNEQPVTLERPEQMEAPAKMTLDCGDGVTLELAKMPAGIFMMGSPVSEAKRWDDEERHWRRINESFYMGTHEVTQAQYRAIMGTNPSRFKGDDLPVENVLWMDAAEFCRRLSEKTGRRVRLPTEVEWEYACRAGTTTPFNTGETIGANQANMGGHDERGNLPELMSGGTVPAGSYFPNDWGLYDMHGNVAEWCSDWYEDYWVSAFQIDPHGAQAVAREERVARGGSWPFSPRFCRSASRDQKEPDDRRFDLGFRVSLDEHPEHADSSEGKDISLPEAESAEERLEEMDASSKMTLDCGNGVTLELVKIAAGTFMMGSPESEAKRENNEIQRRVTLSKPFYLGTHEVTQAQYRAIMGTNPSAFRGDDLPVERVSWEDATEFCRRLSAKTGRSVRLPTEAEWEYACRAGTTTPFNTGGTISTEQENYEGSSVYGDGRKEAYWNETVPPGSYAPNAWGLYDMHGNVVEWCSDWYGEYDAQDAVDPQGAESGVYRVARGGAWYGTPGYCRSAYRHPWLEPGDKTPVLGFRVSLDGE